MNSPSILWHDYETWGVNPKKDFACQFAALRTDYDLNPIEKPINWYCQIPNDYLPHPMAALITGITPQQTLRDGLIEAEFVSKIHHEFSKPNTCGAGYNSIRFDDEVTRNALYRNFYDPYAREWQHGNSRWDIIDLARACYALRPDGVQWVYNDDGVPSFKLDQLSVANEIEHADAHDALSDVLATIGLAKKIKTAQPKLYDFIFQLRKKQQVKNLLDLDRLTPLVHISSKLPAAHGCCTWIVPLAWHPTNPNAVIVANLELDPTPLMELSEEALREKLYQPNSMLAESEQRLPLKLIHINKCPIVAPAKSLNEAQAHHLGIDRTACLQHLAQLKAAMEDPKMTVKLRGIFEHSEEHKAVDADFALYTGGFFSDADRQKMQQVLKTNPQDLGTKEWHFEDNRLNTLLFRFRGRNYPHTLTAQELEKWQRHREFRLTDPSSGSSMQLQPFIQEIEQLMSEFHNVPKKLSILRDLLKYAENL